ncbi:MAG: hypothetical protein HQ478_03285 [Chloroflexi bacterium]|nr:hypothetical protein [Chloroflexota bacterium]
MTTGETGLEQETKPTGPPRKYQIDFKALEASGRSAAFVVLGRCCWQCQSVIEEQPELAGDLKYLMKQITTDCSQRADYLLPGTPLTEAVFRLMVATGNKPLTIQEIADQLSTAWASIIYMKDLSEDLLTRLLDTDNDYMISAVKK